MNVDRLIQLAEWLEAGAKHERIAFDMANGILFLGVPPDPSAVSGCNSSCCIAGAAVQFFGDVQAVADADAEFGLTTAYIDFGLIHTEAGSLLGLPWRLSTKLFLPSWYLESGEHLKDFNDPAWAARTIRHLIATGEVDWEATRAPLAALEVGSAIAEGGDA